MQKAFLIAAVAVTLFWSGGASALTCAQGFVPHVAENILERPKIGVGGKCVPEPAVYEFCTTAPPAQAAMLCTGLHAQPKLIDDTVNMPGALACIWLDGIGKVCGTPLPLPDPMLAWCMQDPACDPLPVPWFMGDTDGVWRHSDSWLTRKQQGVIQGFIAPSRHATWGLLTPGH